MTVACIPSRYIERSRGPRFKLDASSHIFEFLSSIWSLDHVVFFSLATNEEIFRPVYLGSPSPRGLRQFDETRDSTSSFSPAPLFGRSVGYKGTWPGMHCNVKSSLCILPGDDNLKPCLNPTYAGQKNVTGLMDDVQPNNGTICMPQGFPRKSAVGAIARPMRRCSLVKCFAFQLPERIAC